ncbi:MAG: hypothetical protein J7K75_03095 [Desulfuromonas sp.]|nr:hypothetical protein [Desulfuromonas sp.]
MKTNKGFTKPEIAVALLIVVVLLAVMAPRLLRFQAEAERAEVDLVTSSIRSALSLKLSNALVYSDGIQRIEALVGSNPMLLLDQPPSGYRGEVKGWLEPEFPGGIWYYNQKSQALCYRTKWPEVFGSQMKQPIHQLEFKLVAVWADKKQKGRSPLKVFSGVRLEKTQL